MSDEADLAQGRMELEEEIRKKYIAKPTKEAEATGLCLNCGEPVKGEQRWCDVSCRNDWQARRRQHGQ